MTIFKTIQDQLFTQLANVSTASRWVLAYSGGLDSSVLLHALVELMKYCKEQQDINALDTRNNPQYANVEKKSVRKVQFKKENIKKKTLAKFTCPEICVLHVHHGLNMHADQWAQHCQSEAVRYGLKFNIEYVCVRKLTRQGLEASARNARYAAFKKFLKPHDVLLQAHHANDQVETLLLRLMRGAGLKGLGAMPQYRTLGVGMVLRPLLVVTRDELHSYAQQHNLLWVEDDSNSDETLDRNFIRHKILPIFSQRWPRTVHSAMQSLEWLKEAQQLGVEIGAVDLNFCQRQKSSWASESVCYEYFKRLSPARAKNMLRLWLETYASISLAQKHLVQILQDDFKRIELPAEKVFSRELAVESLSNEILAALPAESCKYKLVLEVFENRLHCYFMPEMRGWKIIAQQKFELTRQQPLTIAGVGRLSLQASQALNVTLTVVFKKGGERSHPQNRPHSQQLKKLFQEYSVPRWWRWRVPLLYANEQLVGVADLWWEKSAIQFKECSIIWERAALPTDFKNPSN